MILDIPILIKIASTFMLIGLELFTIKYILDFIDFILFYEKVGIGERIKDKFEEFGSLSISVGFFIGFIGINFWIWS